MAKPTPDEEITTPDVTEAPPETKPPLDGVFVVRGRDEQGNIQTDVILQGDVSPTEVQTVLELAIRGFRQRIGLTP